MSRAHRDVLRENLPFIVVAIVVIGFMVALLADFPGYRDACKHEQNETVQYFCYLNTSVTSRDVRLCNRLYEADARNGCFSYYAIETRDFAPCTSVSSVNGKEFCYANVAVAKRDSDLCASVKVASYREGCFERFAVAEHNETLCVMMSNDSDRASCIVSVQRAIVLQKR